MLDEDETERRELSRLLATAKGEDRKERIRKAIQALDSSEKDGQDTFNVGGGMRPTLATSLSQSQMQSLDMFGSSSKMRPASARRRPSVPNLLDVIHETNNSSKTHTDKIDEFILPLEEIAEVVSSSYDGRFPPKGLFHHSANQSPNRFLMSPNLNESEKSKSWVSTGLTPQFITVMFFEKWIVRKISIKCYGIEKIGTQINSNVTSTTVSQAKILNMRQIDDGTFIVDVSEEAPHMASGRDSTSLQNSEGISGIGITIVVMKANRMFYGISDVEISAMPHS